MSRTSSGSASDIEGGTSLVDHSLDSACPFYKWNVRLRASRNFTSLLGDLTPPEHTFTLTGLLFILRDLHPSNARGLAFLYVRRIRLNILQSPPLSTSGASPERKRRGSAGGCGGGLPAQHPEVLSRGAPASPL